MYGEGVYLCVDATVESLVCRWKISEVAKRPAAASAHPACFGLHNYRLQACAHRRMVQFLSLTPSPQLLELNRFWR